MGLRRRQLQSPPRVDDDRHAGLPGATTPSASARRSIPARTTRGVGRHALLLDEGILEVRCLTEKGRRLFAGHTEPSDRKADRSGAGPETRVSTSTRWASSWTAASKTRSGRSWPGDASAAGPVPTPARRAIASTSSTKGPGGKACGPELGRLPVRPCSRCTPRATTRGASRPSGSGSGSTTSSSIYPEKFGDVALHRLRQLHAELPGRTGRPPGACGDFAEDATPAVRRP